MVRRHLMFSRSLIYLLLLLALFSCKQASIRDIRGTIVGDEGEPLVGANVTFRFHIPNGGSTPNGHYHYDSTITDNNGFVRFNRRKKLAWEHWIIVRHPNYSTQWFDLHGEKNPFKLKLEYPGGYVLIRVKKNTATNSKIKISNSNKILLSKQTSLPYDSIIGPPEFVRVRNDYKISWIVNDTSTFNATLKVSKGENLIYMIEYD